MVVLHQPRCANDFDSGPNPVPITLYAHGADKNPVIGAGGSIVEQFCRTADRRNNHVDFAVVIQVTESAPPMRGSKLQCDSGFVANVLKCAIVHVAENGVGLAIVLLPINIGILAYVGICREQVLVAVVVKVLNADTPAAHLETAKPDTRLVAIIAE